MASGTNQLDAQSSYHVAHLAVTTLAPLVEKNDLAEEVKISEHALLALYGSYPEVCHLQHMHVFG